MKNLFKNLMLVAVAAMAFTACTETNEEVNAVSKKTVLNGVVGFAEETRSGFSEETSTNDEGKTVYHSEWDGNESILVVCNGQAKTATITKNDEGNANFTVEFDGELGDLYYVSVYSPASAFDQSGYCTIPSEQTPRANSVDPAAHALSVSSTPVSAGSAYFAMQHSAAYGKMTVNGVDFAIDHVVVNLKGSYYNNDRELSYTINATNVQNNTFWFATEPIDVAKFTVTAYDAEGNSVAKTVDVAAAGKTMSFNYGRVGTFSVSDLKEYYDYTSARVSWNWGSADKLISFTSAAGEEDFHVNFNGRSFSDNSIAAGDYSIGDGIYGYGITLGDYFGEGEYKTAYTGNVSVTIVNGCYVMVFTDIKDVDNNMLAERITFKGQIDGMEIPDPRAKLAAPDVTATVSGKTITLKWDSVEGAEGYRVKLYSPYEEYFEEVVTDTEYVYTAQLGNTNYSFTIMSYASQENTQYRSSDDAYVNATTEDTDPKMELSESKLTFTADGGEKTFTVTLKNTDAAIEFTKEGDWFSVDMSGNTFTVTAEANDSETDGRDGSITVTAGELTQTIAVAQSKKAAEGGDVENATPIDRFVINYLSNYDETEVKFFLNSGSFDIICIDVPGELQSKTYSVAAGTIYRQYCYVQHPTGNEVLTDDMELTVTVNGDGTYTFKGRVKTTTNEYIINCTGTPTIG